MVKGHWERETKLRGFGNYRSMYSLEDVIYYVYDVVIGCCHYLIIVCFINIHRET